MGEAGETETTPGEIARGLGKALAALSGIASALMILPTLPYVLVAGMAPDANSGNLILLTPLLFALSVGGALFCLKRFTIVRLLIATVPTGYVLFHWFS